MIGRTVTLGSHSYEVIGIAPRGFSGANLEEVEALGDQPLEGSGVSLVSGEEESRPGLPRAHLRRGGHDPEKVFAAFQAAVRHQGQPTVILAKTVKGYGLGEAGEGRNVAHNQKKMNEEELLEFRTRFGIPLSDDDARAALDDPAYHAGLEQFDRDYEALTGPRWEERYRRGTGVPPAPMKRL